MAQLSPSPTPGPELERPSQARHPLAGWLRSSWLAPTLVILVLYGYIGWRAGGPNHDFLSNMQVGSKFVQPSRLLPGQHYMKPSPGQVESVGYDGQFYFVISQDPFLTNSDTAHSLDNTLRYRRLLYPLLVWIFSLGQRILVPYVLVLVNLLMAVGLTAMGARAAAAKGRSPWWALCLGLFSGLWLGVILDLSEPTHLFFLMTGALAGSAGLTFLSALAKETSAVVMAVNAARSALDRNWREAVRWGAAGGVMVVWSLLVFKLLKGAAESTLGGHFLEPIGAPFVQIGRQWGAKEILLVPAVFICMATVARLGWVRNPSAWSAAAYALVCLGAGNDTWVDVTAYQRVIAGAVVLLFASWVRSGDRLGTYVLLLAGATGIFQLLPVLGVAG